MCAYIISNLNVIILRKRLKKAPRTFKVPCGLVIPVCGIIGNIIMIWNIDGNSDVKKSIYCLCLFIFALLVVYGFIWTKFIMKKKLFKPIPLHEVMAMENELYLIVRRKK